ncbi:MAG: hypothetical protein LUC33_03840 [Prevotellaceae bacterium]|nr:hypothetical protein [Prevotellaceae bacterium]
MRKQIYQAIVERLTERVEAVKFVSIWNNNIAVLAGGAVWPRPAVFVEFESIEWRQQNKWARRGDLAVRLHVVTDAVNYNGSTDSERQERALAYFDLLDEINAAMQDLRGENFTGFMLTTSATNHDHAELIESVERYVTSVQDISAMRTDRQVSADGLTVKRA